MSLTPAPAPAIDGLQRVERVAKLLDEAFRIPGTGIKVGLDSIIGLIPVVGDVAGVALGSWFIYEAHRLGAPAVLKWKMARNVAIDAVAGLVPVVGDIVDVAYRSNRRNLAQLRGHFAPSSQAQGTSQTRSLVLRLAFGVGIAAIGFWFFFR